MEIAAASDALGRKGENTRKIGQIWRGKIFVDKPPESL
jgi:hypothetical protein